MHSSLAIAHCVPVLPHLFATSCRQWYYKSSERLHLPIWAILLFQPQAPSLLPDRHSSQEVTIWFTKMSFSIAAVAADVPGLLSSIERRSSGVKSGCLMKEIWHSHINRIITWGWPTGFFFCQFVARELGHPPAVGRRIFFFSSFLKLVYIFFVTRPSFQKKVRGGGVSNTFWKEESAFQEPTEMLTWWC